MSDFPTCGDVQATNQSRMNEITLEIGGYKAQLASAPEDRELLKLLTPLITALTNQQTELIRSNTGRIWR